MKTRFFLLASIALLALTGYDRNALAASPVESNSKYCYQPCVVTLRGSIKTTWTYGPPNFGDPKTDNKVVIFVLVLDRKISIRESNLFDAANGVSQVQLNLPYGMQRIENNRWVIVTGRLQQGITATDIYPIVMQVSAIKPE